MYQSHACSSLDSPPLRLSTLCEPRFACNLPGAPHRCPGLAVFFHRFLAVLLQAQQSSKRLWRPLAKQVVTYSWRFWATAAQMRRFSLLPLQSLAS